jgi:hypothetical protein
MTVRLIALTALCLNVVACFSGFRNSDIKCQKDSQCPKRQACLIPTGSEYGACVPGTPGAGGTGGTSSKAVSGSNSSSTSPGGKGGSSVTGPSGGAGGNLVTGTGGVGGDLATSTGGAAGVQRFFQCPVDAVSWALPCGWCAACTKRRT